MTKKWISEAGLALSAISLIGCGGAGNDSKENTVNLEEDNLEQTVYAILESQKYFFNLDRFLTDAPSTFYIKRTSTAPQLAESGREELLSSRYCQAGSYSTPDLPEYTLIGTGDSELEFDWSDAWRITMAQQFVYILPAEGTVRTYWDNCLREESLVIDGHVDYVWNYTPPTDAAEINIYKQPSTISKFSFLESNINVYLNGTYLTGVLTVVDNNTVSYEGSFEYSGRNTFSAEKVYDPDKEPDLDWNSYLPIGPDTTATITTPENEKITYLFHTALSEISNPNSCLFPSEFRILNSDGSIQTTVEVRNCRFAVVNLNGQEYVFDIP